MPTLLYRDLGLVKGVAFDSWRRIGSLMQAIKVYNMREVDELVFLDITATPDGREPDFELVDDFADECFMPLAVGGGVRSAADVGRLLEVGADKVVINTAAIDDPGVVESVAARFGSQCVVVAIDAKRDAGGRFEVFTNSGRQPTGLEPVETAERLVAAGAGEILVTSIDRDGTMSGYDLDLVGSIAGRVGVPVIASGGAGSYADLFEAFSEGHADAVAAASMFHFTEQTPLEAKRYLHERGVPVRL